jgi:hypothetical protein
MIASKRDQLSGDGPDSGAESPPMTELILVLPPARLVVDPMKGMPLRFVVLPLIFAPAALPEPEPEGNRGNEGVGEPMAHAKRGDP